MVMQLHQRTYFKTSYVAINLCMERLCLAEHGNFKTSYVAINHGCYIVQMDYYSNFKTSYVAINHVFIQINRSVKCISKHHMLLLIYLK